MSNATTKSLIIGMSVLVLVLAVVIVQLTSASAFEINQIVRRSTAVNNLTMVSTPNTTEVYQSYKGTGEYDGTYKPTEVLAFIKANTDKNIYIETDSTSVNVTAQSYALMSLDEYLEEGSDELLRQVVFDGGGNGVIEYLCYIEAQTDGTIDAIHYVRRVI